MYPQGELDLIASRKARLERKIARQRVECAEAVATVVQPLELIDRVRAQWRNFSPLVKFITLPLGLLAKRSASPWIRMFGTVLRWGPLAMSVVRGVNGARHEFAHR